MGSTIIPFVTLFFGVVLGLGLGFGGAWFYWKAESAELRAKSTSDEEKIEWIRDSQDRLRETFEALASRALHNNSQQFSGNISNQLTSHAQNIGVLKTALDTNLRALDGKIRELEKNREGAYQALRQQVEVLSKAHGSLLQTTEQLVNALSSGPVRGRWGEIQLRKIVELAGMTEHVSFHEQIVGTAGGKPDTLVHLPNEGKIALDSKFPLKAFLEGMATNVLKDRKIKFEEHVKVMKEKIRELSKRSYWKEFDPSPELTILFVPIESCLMVAYEHDPSIIEYALEHKIILASPITLLGYLKSIAYGWQEFTISKNARKILSQGKELYGRIDVWLDHFKKTGEKLTSTVKSYNEAVGSLQSRVVPSCRRFQELAAIADDLPEVEPLSIGINVPPSSGSNQIAQDKTTDEGGGLF